MDISDTVTFERGEDVRHINIDELIKTFESNGIKIDPAISEKIVNYSLEFHPRKWTSRESFVPIGIHTEDLSVVGYILRNYDEKRILEIELQNSQRGSVSATYNVPKFQIKVESDSESGMETINNVRKSLECFNRRNYE